MTIGLRDAILQAAVQGKLTEREAGDEPAKTLLERIRAERAETVKRGEAKAPKGGESVIERRPDGIVWEKRGKGDWVDITEEIPFDIPDEWEWVRLQSIYNFIDYRGKTPKKSESGVHLVTASNVRFGYMDYSRDEYISEEEYETRLSRGVTKKGDIFITTEAPMGFCAINEYEKCSAGQRVITLQHYGNAQLNNVLFCDFILSPFFQTQIKENATGTTAKGIKGARLQELLIPLPPIGEQQRIVAKLEEMLPKAERAEALDAERMELTRAFPDAMRASILQAAVQGELTERDAGDEPACDLLARVREERREMVKNKLAKAPKGGESVIQRRDDGSVWEKRGKGDWTDITEEVPFDIPDEWEWARLEDIAASVLVPFADGPFGSNLKKEHYIDEPEVRIIQLSNIGEDGWRDENVKYTSFKHLETIARCEAEPGDIVIAKMMPAGRAIILPDLGTKMVLSSDAVKFVANEALCKKYVLWAINSPCFRQHVADEAHGMTRVRTSVTKLRNDLFPVPSFQEQQRIVDKIEEMLSMVERLSSKVAEDAA